MADGLLDNLKLKVNAMLRQKCRISQDDLATCTGPKSGYMMLPGSVPPDMDTSTTDHV